MALTAMELATVSRMFHGRFRFGIGHGVQEWMGQVGSRVHSPVTLLREYTTALRSLLGGATVDTTGAYVQLRNVTLDWPPGTPPKLLVGAIGPKTLALSAQLADGTILTDGTSQSAVRRAREMINESRAAAGVTRPHTLVVYLITDTGNSAQPRLRRELERWGFDTTAEVGISGGAQDVAAGAPRWIDAGADTVVLQPTQDEPDVEDFIRFVAHEVRPLV